MNFIRLIKKYRLLRFLYVSSVLVFLPMSVHAVDPILELELEELLDLEVTSVSKKKQRLTEAAAAVHVITQHDIRRSGVTSIPEALRLSPGLQVAKIDNNKWAISSRGFNAQFSNNLLVLIDGRTVYTPSFSGVYWEVQDTVLEDVERIEVIRGPGATLWGSNAVNGVINIITKHASDTQGGLVTAGAGNKEEGFTSLRYGAKLGETNYGRAYVKYNDKDSSHSDVVDGDAGDDWQALRTGFRVDGLTNESNQWTLQGDFYNTNENQIARKLFTDPADPTNSPPYNLQNTAEKVDTSGWNILGRWEHTISDESIATLQVYYDHNDRDEFILEQRHDALDIDFHHQFSIGQNNELVWGMGYRNTKSSFENSFPVAVFSRHQSLDLYNAFIQNEFSLIPDSLRLTVGSKFEHNHFTGTEVQPSIRLLWLPKQGHTLWGAVSRAVRTPAQTENNSRIVADVIPIAPPPVPPIVTTANGDKDYSSEELTAYEIGYRVQASKKLSVDVTVFYNEYDNLASFEPATPISQVFDNKLEATSHGLELHIDWRPLEWWSIQANYSYLDISGSTDNDSADTFSSGVIEGSSPDNQFSISSYFDLPHNLSLNLWSYYVGELDSTSFTDDYTIEDYISVNARVGWQPSESVEISVTGHNLLESRHEEFTGEIFSSVQTEVERSIYAQVRWVF